MKIWKHLFEAYSFVFPTCTFFTSCFPLTPCIRPSDTNLHLHIYTSCFLLCYSFSSDSVLFPSFRTFLSSSLPLLCCALTLFFSFQHVQGKTLGIHNSEKAIYMCHGDRDLSRLSNFHEKSEQVVYSP